VGEGFDQLGVDEGFLLVWQVIGHVAPLVELMPTSA
jgi:hypothetical protein